MADASADTICGTAATRSGRAVISPVTRPTSNCAPALTIAGSTVLMSAGSSWAIMGAMAVTSSPMPLSICCTRGMTF